MLLLSLSPIRMDAVLQLEKAGDVLVVNGEALDFTPLSEGACLPRDAVDCRWLASDVRREGGVLQLTLLAPHGAVPEPPPLDASRVLAPSPIEVHRDGPILLPAFAPMDALHGAQHEEHEDEH